LVNSSYYGFPREISTVTDAVVILGFDTVRNLALSASIVKIMKKGGSFDKSLFWHHTVAVAFMARIIAKHVKYSNVEVAFVAGLLHDIAKVFEDQYFSEEFMEATNMSEKRSEQLYITERETLGYDHATIGKRLADSWNLPKSIVAAMAYHHDLDKNIYPEHIALVDIIYLSDILVRLKKIGNSGNYGKTSVSKKVLERLKLKKENLVGFLKELDVELNKGNSFIELIND
jgi:putative nucleotidyltransferase with HDIG domain